MPVNEDESLGEGPRIVRVGVDDLIGVCGVGSKTERDKRKKQTGEFHSR
jgi:hypothetical protein